MTQTANEVNNPPTVSGENLSHAGPLHPLLYVGTEKHNRMALRGPFVDYCSTD